MASKSQAARSGSALSAQVVRTLREGALYVFGAFALILWFALFTYHPGDPGFSQASSNLEIQNGVGRVGAHIADMLFNLFGRPAYLRHGVLFRLDDLSRAAHATDADAR